MSSFLASLSTVSSVFSAIVVYGAGVALGSTKNQFQGIATAVATTGYLAQRITFMILAEDIPDINCATANAASYSFLCIMRLAILAGLTLRARGSISMQFSVVLTSANFVAVVLGIASVGILIYQACVSPYVPGTCIQGLDRTVTFVGNIMFVIALTILTIVLSVPIFKTLAVANTTGPTTSRIHNQIRILSRFLRLFPLGLCVLITVMMVWSSHISNVFCIPGFAYLCGLVSNLVVVVPHGGDCWRQWRDKPREFKLTVRVSDCTNACIYCTISSNVYGHSTWQL
ncbi:hypothetical protein BASA61_010293 [Batrachochytrium salamandrivorans]|nr:hypothetical protein BASA61_010293 [Batrachochytrium salamandrivorans]